MCGIRFCINFFLFLVPGYLLGQVETGKFDASQLESNPTINLAGEWEFYPNKLISGKDFETYPSRSPIFIAVPATWNSQGFPGKGVGTYRIKLYNLPVDQLLSLSIPNVYSSYNLYINDELVASNGVVAEKKENYQPQWLVQTVTFNPKSEEADLIIHVANFHHNRGGIHKNIAIGDYKSLNAERENELMAQMMLFSGLIVLGIFFLALFLIRAKRDYFAILLFGLFCIAWAGRVFFAHIYLRSFFFPDINWGFSLKIEYILLYISLACGVAFINEVYQLGKTMGFRLMMMANFLFILLTMFLPTEIYTALLQVYLLLAVVNFIYMSYAIIKAIINKKSAAFIGGIAIILALAIFIYEILAYQFEWTLNHLILQSTYLSVFIINSFILAHGFVMQERKIEKLEEQQYNFLKGRAI